jgi:hypothetical protein
MVPVAVQSGAYGFRSVWRLAADIDRVYDVLADLGRYPSWWPQVRRVEPYGDETATLVIRSALPYSLRLRVRTAREDRAGRVLEARIGGDLEGWSRWSLRAADAGCEAVFEEQVAAQRHQLRQPIARAAFELNHAWMMRSGELGLRRWLRSHRKPSP